MKCPVCSESTLKPNEIAAHLLLHTCPSCQGDWLRFDDYLDWHDKYSGEAASQGTPDDYQLKTYDKKTAKDCPDCATVMTRYLVSSDLDFAIDKCEACHGVWFDKNEFEVMQSLNLHLEIEHIFTETWQNKLQEPERKAQLKAYYMRRFGSEDYARIEAFKLWMNEHPAQKSMLVFLIKKDPLTFLA